MAAQWPPGVLADAAGESEERLRWYADVGLLHRQADGDFEADSLHRVRLIQFARSRGFDDQQLVAVTASQGDLLGMFQEIEPSTAAGTSLVDAAREAGLDDALSAELADLLDWADVGAPAESDLAALQVLARALELGMPQDALLQVVRVLADATDWLADAVVRTYHNYVHERFRAQGLAGPELLEINQGVGRPLLDLLEPAVIYFHRRAYRRANREDMLRHLAEETTPPAATPGEEQATVLFVDLASFTPLAATMGDYTAADVLRRFTKSVRSNATRFRGRILKQIGDAFMLRFAVPSDAIGFGLGLDRFVDAEPLFPALHIGAHYGGVLYRDGDYVGATVNLAARVATAGAAGQFLITEALREVAGEPADAEFIAVPPQRLKGIPEPIRLVEVRRLQPHRSDRETDPVCGLLLHVDDVQVRTTWHGRTFAFCCEMCQQAFAENPGRFAAS